MNTCKTCKHWAPQKNFHPLGICENKKLCQDWHCITPDGLGVEHWGVPSPWTGPDFGCIHHEPK